MMLERSGVFPITKRRYLIIFISCLYPHTVLARCPGHTPQLYHICVMSRIGYFIFNGIYFVIETLFNLVPAKFELFQRVQYVDIWDVWKGQQNIVLSCIYIQFCAFFAMKFCFVCKLSQNYTDLMCLLDIKVLIQQTKGACARAVYCSGGKL